jgi:predicted ATPase/class 3 adenylate cyclase
MGNLDNSSSTYTFLFTDIEGSTRYWEHNPDAMRAALDRHNFILREAIESHGGWVFRTAGDAYFASFTTAAAALKAAVQGQCNLYAEAWELDVPLQVRMAIHSGEAEERDGDYVGGSLNRIGRLITVSHGGQILLTQATQELVRDSLPEGVMLIDLGRHRFKDLVHPERVFQVVTDGLQTDFPPIKSLESIPNNLPSQLTSFIGRQAELAKANELLTKHRLLTLTGAGGTGKTRLALQVAANQLENFSDGVWFVELASLSDPSQVYRSIARVFNLREQPGLSLGDSILDALLSRNLLLVLDNCEHLIETCSQLADKFLRSTRAIKILASSREVLGIEGEVTLRVPPLSLPSPSDHIPIEELYASEAVQLFVERARVVQHSFELNEQNAAIISQISRRLDGIPLAIELSAARIRLLKPEQIAARLDDLFKLLTGGSRSALPRQQTLEAMIDWSHNLLSAEERVLFRRLSVFVGGWNLEAAEMVCSSAQQDSSSQDPALFPEDVLDLLAQLVNKSLVQVEEDEVEARYRLLETIRQYALKKLMESGEVAVIRQNHMRYFNGYSSQARDGMLGDQQSEWMNYLEQDHDNLRSALDWALDHDPLTALEIGANLVYFWSGRGYSSEGRQRLQSALDRLDDSPELFDDPQCKYIEARALSAYGQMAIIQGDNAAARQVLQRCVDIQREIGEQKEVIFSIALLSLATLFLGDIAGSRSLAEEGVSLGRQFDEPIGLALSLSILAQINVRSQDSYQLARQQIDESARLLRLHGNRWFAGLSLMGLGITAHLADDMDTALAHYRESQRIFMETGDQHFSTVTNSYMADIARMQGNFVEATRIYRETLQAWLRMGHKGGIARSLECLAFIAFERAGEVRPADRPSILGEVALLLGAAENMRQASGQGMTIDEQLEYYGKISAIREAVDQDAKARTNFDLAWSQGQRLNIDKLLQLAMQD